MSDGEVSTRTKIEQLSGLLGTRDLTQWEARFIDDMTGFLQPLSQVEAMSPQEVKKVDQIWSKHFTVRR